MDSKILAHREAVRRYKQIHKEKCQEYNRQYYLRNREKFLERSQRSYEMKKAKIQVS